MWLMVLLLLLPGGEHSGVLSVPLGLDAYMPMPEDNTLTPEKAALGRRLFFDARLSRDGRVSCAGCHDPKHGFRDGRPVAIGVFGRAGSRRVPSLINRGYGKAFFWDGRISGLEQQVLQPILNPQEMDMRLEEAVSRIHDRDPEFRRAFGREANPRDLARALASYVRTILSGDSPYDRYIAGDRQALPEEALAGLRVFRGKGNCVACHVGANLTDERFHNTGVAWKDGRFTDAGRFAATHDPDDLGAFKTPTLREAALSPPYMHDGSLGTLEDVVRHYDEGGTSNPHLDPEIHPLHLSAAEKRALVAFLRSLSGTIREGI